MAAKKKAHARTASNRAKKKVVLKTKTKGRALARPAKAKVKKAKVGPSGTRRSPDSLSLEGFTPSITVNDLARSLAFYTKGLGFTLSQEWKDGEVLRGVMLKAGDTELALSQDDWKLGRDRAKGAALRIFCNTLQDIDVIASRLKATGSALTEEPEDRPAWGMRTFSVDDPDGFHLTISRKL